MKLLLTASPGLDNSPYGHVVVVDWKRREVIDSCRYQHGVYPQSHKGLAGASRHQDRLLVAAEAEVLEFELNKLKQIQQRTFHYLNDVHHVVSTKDRFWICNTGLDCIEELDSNWEHVATHHLVAPFARRPMFMCRLLSHDVKKSWKRMRGLFDYYTHLTERAAFRNIVKLCNQNAYRRNGRELRFTDFRPHALHPNHIIAIGDEIWVTLLMTGELVSLNQKKVLAKDLGYPHDGVPFEDEYIFTDCTINRLVIHEWDPDSKTLGPVRKSKVIVPTKSDGFLRGVAPTRDRIFVALSARRGAPAEKQVARVLELSRETLEPVDEWTMPAEFGRGLFSLMDVTPEYS